MEKGLDEPRSLLFSIRLYGALLAVYPTEFRRTYGGPMRQLFADCCRRALREAGPAGLLALWWRILVDIVQTALEEHSQRGVEMTREKFYKLSGWAMIAGPIIFLIGAWAKTRPPYIPYPRYSLPIDRYAVPAATPLVVIGLVFMSLGILGIMLRYSPKWNGAGIMLEIGALAGLVSAVGAAGLEAISDGSPWWEMFIIGLAGQYLALIVFGFVTMRFRLLPRWNGLPILALWFPIALFLSMGLIPWELTNQMVGWLWLLSCVLFGGLGYLLMSDPQPARAAAAT